MRFAYSTILLLTLTGCTLFEYHPYEVRVPEDERDWNAKSIRRILAANYTDDTVTVLHMGDTQRFYDEVEDFVKSANRVEADFVLLAGDISDFGLNDEFQWIHDILKRLNKPYVAVVGNHDLLGNGQLVFEERYGPVDDAFTVNGIKFVLLNTNSREYSFDGAVPNIPWLTQELTDPLTRHAVVVSHVPPYDADFDPSLEDKYVHALRSSGNVRVSLHAHRHAYQNAEYYQDGIQYIVSTSMDNRMYLQVKLWPGGYAVKKIYY